MSVSKFGNNNDSDIVGEKLYVKYMVCLRDKMIVQSELDRLGLTFRMSDQGAIEFLDEITKIQYNELKKGLSKSGLILLEGQESMLIDRIINTILEVIHHSDKLPKISFTDIINEQKEMRGESILKIFSDVKGMSVIQFIVIHKIERAKELLLYENRSLPEIADILNYKNQDYLVVQFKKLTGLTPAYFMKLKNERRKLLLKAQKIST